MSQQSTDVIFSVHSLLFISSSIFTITSRTAPHSYFIAVVFIMASSVSASASASASASTSASTYSQSPGDQLSEEEFETILNGSEASKYCFSNELRILKDVPWLDLDGANAGRHQYYRASKVIGQGNHWAQVRKHYIDRIAPAMPKEAGGLDFNELIATDKLDMAFLAIGIYSDKEPESGSGDDVVPARHINLVVGIQLGLLPLRIYVLVPILAPETNITTIEAVANQWTESELLLKLKYWPDKKYHWKVHWHPRTRRIIQEGRRYAGDLATAWRNSRNRT
jgi:hypothetical protein